MAGFADGISYYALSDVALKLGERERACDLALKSKRLLGKTGRQYNVVGLGSIFFDVIGDSIERSQGQRLL